MGKGRRVRALVACPRNDESCSPNPKRRGANGSWAGPHPDKTPNRAITAFFRSVGKTHGRILDETLDEEDEDKDLFVGCDLQGNIGDEKNDMEAKTEPDDTPLSVVKRRYLNESSPPTPHRIEFVDSCEEPKDLAEPKTTLSKGRRKLKNNPPINCPDSQGGVPNLTNNHKLTEYFPVRRSARKTQATVLEEKQRTLEKLLRKQIEDGLMVKHFQNKGRGVVAARRFFKGDFVVEYSGDLIDIAEAKKREDRYSQDQNTGCYMYYFKHNDQQYCIDATAESGRLGRLVNHSRNGNLLTRTVFVDGEPRLVLLAKDDIKEGEEVTYDYGDRSKEALKHHPWLAY